MLGGFLVCDGSSFRVFFFFILFFVLVFFLDGRVRGGGGGLESKDASHRARL